MFENFLFNYNMTFIKFTKVSITSALSEGCLFFMILWQTKEEIEGVNFVTIF